jgi:hypothetical protein
VLVVGSLKSKDQLHGQFLFIECTIVLPEFEVETCLPLVDIQASLEVPLSDDIDEHSLSQLKDTNAGFQFTHLVVEPALRNVTLDHLRVILAFLCLLQSVQDVHKLLASETLDQGVKHCVEDLLTETSQCKWVPSFLLMHVLNVRNVDPHLPLDIHQSQVHKGLCVELREPPLLEVHLPELELVLFDNLVFIGDAFNR